MAKNAPVSPIGFRVCKWTGVPEKHVQSFAFYMGDAQPKHAEKGSSTPCLFALIDQLVGVLIPNELTHEY